MIMRLLILICGTLYASIHQARWNDLDSVDKSNQIGDFLEASIEEGSLPDVQFFLQQPESASIECKVLAKKDLLTNATDEIKNELSQYYLMEQNFYNHCVLHHATQHLDEFLDSPYFKESFFLKGWERAVKGGHTQPLASMVNSKWAKCLSQDELLKCLVMACKTSASILIEPLLSLIKGDLAALSLVELSIVGGDAESYPVVLRLLMDPRINPGANGNAALKKAYEVGDERTCYLLLAHPKVDPDALDELLLPENVGTNRVKIDIELVKPVLQAARTGDALFFDQHLPDLFVNRELIEFPLLAACLHGHLDVAFHHRLNRNTHRRPCKYQNHEFMMPLLMNQPHISKMIMKRDIEISRTCNKIQWIESMLLKLKIWNAMDSIRYLFKKFQKKFPPVKLLIEEFAEKPNRNADLLVEHAERMACELPEIANLIIGHASALLWLHYMKERNFLPTDILDHIKSFCI